METETEWVTLDVRGTELTFSKASLQVLVQAAYDKAGILAEPSFVVEAARVADQSPVETLTDWVDNAEARLNAAHNTGLRAS